MSGTGTPATVAAKRAKVAYTLHTYDHDPRSGVSYGEEAAAALGVPADQVFKTLLATVDGTLSVAVVPVSTALDLKALAAAAGGKKATLADSKDAERATGYVVGGISPLGQKRRLPTYVDESAAEFATVYVSAGRRGLDIELAPADLLHLTAGTYAPVAARREHGAR
ncbi:MAG: Cys-tRNA(Pro) deacylase [Streptosporangiales bacterium]|nr:Cys-tRNA(Pro) deacylase [Streptosporangiales bacterium]